MKNISIALVLVAFIVIAGCGHKQPGTLIQGTVTLDGAPLATGQIAFIGTDNSTQIFQISAGQYKAQVFPVGEKNILFKSEKVIGTTPRGDFEGDTVMLEKFESILPAKYSKMGTFTMTVGEKSETKNFDLLSKE